MNKFISFLKSEISQGIESSLVRHIANNIMLKNRNADSQVIGDKTMDYLFDIAKTEYAEEVLNTPFAKESMEKPLSTLQTNVWAGFRKNLSMKGAALEALTAFEREFLNNISEYKNVYHS